MGLPRALLDLLLPAACAGCGTALACQSDGPDLAVAPLCAGCDGRVPRLPHARCVVCQEARTALDCCMRCSEVAPALAACQAEVPYEAAAAFVRRFKYPRSGLLGVDPGGEAVCTAWVIAASARVPGPAPAAVIPVPLHPRRLRERAFNPAAVLARRVASAIGVPLRSGTLARVRDTPSQTGLGRRARRSNVAGAFEARRPVVGTVWLVDDVVTTAATLHEAARTLREAGAARVRAVCVARTTDLPAGVEGAPPNG